MALKILVLGASPPDLQPSAQALGDETVEVVSARDLPDALEQARLQGFALALLDLDACGNPAALLSLLASDGLQRAHVLALASSPAQAEALERECSAVVDCLLKPLAPAQLQRRLLPWLVLAARQHALDEQTQDLQRLARLQKKTLRALSHDVRTPLSALSLNAELVTRGSESPALLQAAQRIKAAVAMLDLQIDHLAQVAAPGDAELRPLLRPLDLRLLVQDRVRALSARLPAMAHWTLSGDGDAQLQGDSTLLADAIDGLFKQVAAHAATAAVSVVVDGRSQRVLIWRIQFADVLAEPAKRQFFGTTAGGPEAGPNAGPQAWAEAQAIVRTHGGSLIGRSRPREGSLIECLLPRDVD